MTPPAGTPPHETGRRSIVPATLRARVTAAAALAVLAVLTAASVGLVLAHRAALVEILDDQLDRQADAVESQLRAGRPVRDGDLPSEDVFVEVVAADGTLLAASDGLDERLPRGEDPEDPSTVELADGEPARLVVTDVEGATVLVAGSLDDVGDSTAALAGPLLSPCR